VALVALVLIAPGAINLDLEDEGSLDAASSGRISLMRGGLEMFADRPVAGFGAGSFAEEFREREDVSSEEAASASHTIPITVGAEQGVVGLAAYGLVLYAAFGLLAGGGPLTPTRAIVAAAFAALVFHTLLYAAFLEDPIAWTLLGAAIGLRLSSAESGAPAETGAPAAARTRTGSSSP
jgi:O-antigen ligase